ncbi:MAG: hypothetical protein AAB925_02305 [Patescibacteria group bacterium]
MESRFLSLKNRATSLRKRGLSFRYIENKLGIPRSTLSGWFKNIKLPEKQRKKLLDSWKKGLANARKKAALWHIEDKNKRRETIRQEVKTFFLDVTIEKKMGELIMATFYLAEGGKMENNFSLANSNPEILKGIVNLLRLLYKIDELKFRCALHLRKDQDEKELREFWSKILKIPESQFIKTQFDKRTIKKTYEHYKGVCVLIYYDMALQRRILYLGDEILKNINNKRD